MIFGIIHGTLMTSQKFSTSTLFLMGSSGNFMHSFLRGQWQFYALSSGYLFAMTSLKSYRAKVLITPSSFSRLVIVYVLVVRTVTPRYGRGFR